MWFSKRFLAISMVAALIWPSSFALANSSEESLVSVQDPTTHEEVSVFEYDTIDVSGVNNGYDVTTFEIHNTSSEKAIIDVWVDENVASSEYTSFDFGQFSDPDATALSTGSYSHSYQVLSGDSFLLDVFFDPYYKSYESYSASLFVQSDLSDVSWVVELYGTGYNNLEVVDPDTDEPVTTAFDYGYVGTDTNEVATETIEVRNLADEEAIIDVWFFDIFAIYPNSINNYPTNFSFGEPYSDDDLISDEADSRTYRIAPNSSVLIDVDFDPEYPVYYAVDLYIESDLSNSQWKVNYYGEGVVENLSDELLLEVEDPDTDMQITELDYGYLEVNEDSSIRTVEIENLDTEESVVEVSIPYSYGFSFAPVYEDDILMDTGSASNSYERFYLVKSGETLLVDVKFDPTDDIAYNNNLIVQNLSSAVSATVNLMGAGYLDADAYDFSVEYYRTDETVTSMDYGMVDVGISSMQTIEIENLSEEQRTFYMSFDNDHDGVWALTNSTGTFASITTNILPGEIYSVDVTFSPESPIPYETQLIVENDYLQTYIDVYGEGYSPIDVHEPEDTEDKVWEIDYGTVSVLSSNSKTIEITNNRSSTVTIDVFLDPYSKGFTLGNFPRTRATYKLKAGASVLVDVVFNPQSVGYYGSTLSVKPRGETAWLEIDLNGEAVLID